MAPSIKRTTIRLPTDGHRAIKILAALTGETQPHLIARLVKAELARVLENHPTLGLEPPGNPGDDHEEPTNLPDESPGSTGR
jgi:hypothetical protein